MILAACSGSSEPTPEDVAKMAAQAVDLTCGRFCVRLDVYVVTDLQSESGDGGEAPGSSMPEETQEAIGRAVPDADFVSSEEAEALFTDDSLVDGGRGVIVYVGPVEDVGEDAVSIEVEVVTALEGGDEGVHRFEWDGDNWRPATTDEDEDRERAP